MKLYYVIASSFSGCRFPGLLGFCLELSVVLLPGRTGKPGVINPNASDSLVETAQWLAWFFALLAAGCCWIDDETGEPLLLDVNHGLKSIGQTFSGPGGYVIKPFTYTLAQTSL